MTERELPIHPALLGRPVEGRDSQVHGFRFSAKQWEWICAEAKKQETTTSQFVRIALRKSGMPPQ